MSLSTVQAALHTLAVTALGSIPTEWPNAALARPIAASKWAQVTFMPAQPNVETLGTHGDDMHAGILQIDLNYKIGIGDSESRADYETIRTTFKAGTAIDSGRIMSCGRAGGRFVDNWFRVSISIEWYALIAR